MRSADRTKTGPISHIARELEKSNIGFQTSARVRAEYSSDASNYRIPPLGVVFPRHVDEVLATFAACQATATPVTARGGGTSIAGNAIGPGIVIDFSRHLNRVLQIDPENRTAIVEPGAILDAVNHLAEPHNLRFGPDPSSHSRATIAGSIGNNACGARALGFGRTVDNVAEIDLLTGTGQRLTAAKLSTAPNEIAEPITQLVRSELAMIRTEFGRFSRQGSGYGLQHLLPENGANLAKFLVGSEGTLGITLGATIKLQPTPSAVVLVALGYEDMPAAAAAVPAVLAHRPIAVEGLDSRVIEAARRRRGAATLPDLPRGAGWLFVEVAGETIEDAHAAGRRLAAEAHSLDSRIVSGPAAAALWRAREDGVGLVGRTPANRPAWPGWEDAAVPPSALPSYLREFRRLLDEHHLDALVYGHFGDGCVHARIDFPFAEDGAVFRRFVTEAATLVGAHGGSMSGEHGDGRARSELLPLMYSPGAISAFGAVKRIFDPANLLNPGVLVEPAPLDADLRVPQAQPLTIGLRLAFPADDGDLSTAVHRCVGVGKCRADTTPSGGVMCPSYLATGDEKDSTRGRARVLQELANGSLISSFDSPAVAESLDLCLSCKGCASDCPAGVDMATYKAEVTYQRYRHKLRPRSHYALGWLPRWSRFASYLPRLTNWLLRRRAVTTLIRFAGGLDHRRPLPAYAEQTFRQWFEDRSPTPNGEPVMLWVDTFTNHFSPEVGRAAVRVLEAAGYSVELTSGQVCCGLTWISTGQLDGAARQLRRTLAALESAFDRGLKVVGLEPSCTAVFRDDLARILPDHPNTEVAAQSFVTLAEILTTTPDWKAPDLADVKGIAQPHCHQHAVLGWEADKNLLVGAGADIQNVGGCCGLAGNFGVEKGHYEVSVAVAETALMPAVRAANAGDVILADGFSCRTQLDQLAGATGVHLAQLLDRYLP